MDSMPASARRDNAVFRARQSAALAQVPDPDRAVWAAAEAASAVRATGSARLRRRGQGNTGARGIVGADICRA